MFEHNNVKTKQFCETSSFFELDNTRNEAILRDFFIFRSSRHQKRKNSARLPSKMESWVQSWQPRTNAFCDFCSPPVSSTAPATENWCQVIRSAAPVTQNHLSKPAHLILQNATPLRKSAPWPPNISHEHVFCTAPATRNASLQILFKCPCLPSFLEMLQNPHVLLTFEEVHNPWRLPRETTSELQKWSEAEVLFCTFWTSKGASCHNGMHFFDISTAKSGPHLVCFVHFDLEMWGPTLRCFVHFHFEMCFAPQPRALFRHRNFQKRSETQVFCAFDLQMCFAPQRRAIFHLSSGQLAPHPPLASLLFDPPEPQISGKTQRFATFLPFLASASSFFLTLSLLLFFLLIFLFSPALLFICPYCRKFDFIYCLMQVQCLSPQTPASVAMCFQKKSCPVPFRQPTETNTLACNELRMLLCIAPSEKTNAKKPDRKRQTKGGGRNLVTQTMCLYCLMQVQCLSPQTPASVAMCFQEKCCPMPFLQSTDTTKHRMQPRQQNKNKGFQY